MSPFAVSNVHEALALLAQPNAFDLALIDVEMPSTTGWEVAAAIRRERSEFQLPIAMLTRRGQPRMAEELNIAAFVSEPKESRQVCCFNCVWISCRPVEAAISGGVGRRCPGNRAPAGHLGG